MQKHNVWLCAAYAVFCLNLVTLKAQAQSDAGEQKSFDPGSIREMAKGISTRPYQPPPAMQVARDWSYDDQRKLRFQVDLAPWQVKPPHFEVHPLPAGWIYQHDVEVFLVENGKPRLYRATPCG